MLSKRMEEIASWVLSWKNTRRGGIHDSVIIPDYSGRNYGNNRDDGNADGIVI